MHSFCLCRLFSIRVLRWSVILICINYLRFRCLHQLCILGRIIFHFFFLSEDFTKEPSFFTLFYFRFFYFFFFRRSFYRCLRFRLLRSSFYRCLRFRLLRNSFYRRLRFRLLRHSFYHRLRFRLLHNSFCHCLRFRLLRNSFYRRLRFRLLRNSFCYCLRFRLLRSRCFECRFFLWIFCLRSLRLEFLLLLALFLQQFLFFTFVLAVLFLQHLLHLFLGACRGERVLIHHCNLCFLRMHSQIIRRKKFRFFASKCIVSLVIIFLLY